MNDLKIKWFTTRSILIDLFIHLVYIIGAASLAFIVAIPMINSASTIQVVIGVVLLVFLILVFVYFILGFIYNLMLRKYKEQQIIDDQSQKSIVTES